MSVKCFGIFLHKKFSHDTLQNKLNLFIYNVQIFNSCIKKPKTNIKIQHTFFKYKQNHIF
jgi:hypothetical protein